MDFFKLRAHYLLLLLVLLPMLAAKEDDIPPVLAPYFDNICNDVECGKGSCEKAPGKPFNFICKCERDWKRTHHDDDDHDHDDNDEDDLEFLPCIVPKCSLDYSCLPAPPPAPPIPHNMSFFDPCYWINCGEGTCQKNITHGQTCQCKSGYSNLLGIPAFPCFNDCAIGAADCQKQGIRLSNSTASSPSSSTPSSIFNTNNGGNDSNGATSFMLKNSHWMAIFLASAAMALLN